MHSRSKHVFKNSLVWLSLMLHAFWLIFFIYVAAATHSVKQCVNPDGMYRSAVCVANSLKQDSIERAGELGRLDIVSIGLTMLGTVIALCAFSSFFLLRHAVIENAKEAALGALPDAVRSSEAVRMIAESIKADPVFVERVRKALEDVEMTTQQAEDMGKLA